MRQFLLVTDDGRRPWHSQFRVRETADGRRVAYWWGAFDFESGTRQTVMGRLTRIRRRVLRFLADREVEGDTAWLTSVLAPLKEMRGAAAGFVWYGHISGASEHWGECSTEHFIGIAYLPSSPDCWRLNAVWPMWAHLAHGTYECPRKWDELEVATTEELMRMLGD